VKNKKSGAEEVVWVDHNTECSQSVIRNANDG